jgi:hypothetical protein
MTETDSSLRNVVRFLIKDRRWIMPKQSVIPTPHHRHKTSVYVLVWEFTPGPEPAASGFNDGLQVHMRPSLAITIEWQDACLLLETGAIGERTKDWYRSSKQTHSDTILVLLMSTGRWLVVSNNKWRSKLRQVFYYKCEYSTWLQTGWPGDRGSIPGRGNVFFL